jgi:hypothetical protein
VLDIGGVVYCDAGAGASCGRIASSKVIAIRPDHVEIGAAAETGGRGEAAMGRSIQGPAAGCDPPRPQIRHARLPASPADPRFGRGGGQGHGPVILLAAAPFHRAGRHAGRRCRHRRPRCSDWFCTSVETNAELDAALAKARTLPGASYIEVQLGSEKLLPALPPESLDRFYQTGAPKTAP